MRYANISPILVASLLFLCNNAALAESGSGMGTEQASAHTKTDAFSDLNAAFIKNYSALAERNQKATRPLIITTGFSYELLCEDGTSKTAAPPNPVENRLKAVSHICAYLYSACDMHWRDPNIDSWKVSMISAQRNLDKALAEVDKVSWTSDAWPGGETKLREFIRQSLTNARDFASAAVTNGDVTREQYGEFAAKFLPTLQCTFYLATLSNAHDVLKMLKEWRKIVGEDGWKRMRVVIAAGKGRATAGATQQTNPAAAVMTSVMDPESARTNILMAPAASDTEQALEGLALALTASKLADATFPTTVSQNATWFYSALKHPDIPVALDPVCRVLEDLKKGAARDPILGLGQ